MNEKDIQRLLMDAGYYSGKIDGILGRKSLLAAHKVLENRSKDLPKGWEHWSRARRFVASAQMILRYAGIEDVGQIDGYVGPSTKYALEIYEYEKKYDQRPPTWRDDDFDLEADNPVLDPWPHQTEIRAYYGTPGGPQCTAGKVELPFSMKIAWNTRQTVTRFSCHERVADSLSRVYHKIASAYSPEDISSLGFDLFGGCYNYRRMRGGNSLSTHSWGIAVDIDPERNQLRWGRNKAFLARDRCEEFWRIWESEGWLSLGRARNYDWMHVQAARL